MRKFWWMQGPLHEEAGEGDGSGGGDSDGEKKGRKEATETDDDSSDENDEKKGEKTPSEEDKRKKQRADRALALLDSLEDPERSERAFTAIASALGLKVEKTAGEMDKKEKISLAKRIVAKVGKDYEWLANPLAEAMEDYVNELKGDFDKRLEDMKIADIEKSSNDALSKARSEFKDWKLFAGRIEELMDEITPSPKLSTYEFLTRLYHMARAEKGISSKTPGREERLRQNRSDVGERLSSSSGGNREKPPGKRPKNLDDAIELASRQVEKDLSLEDDE